jgi:hypothetical protein
MYAAALGHIGEAVADKESFVKMGQQQVQGYDGVPDTTTCYVTVFMKPMPREDFGSYLAFGHDGGSIGFADPMYEMSLGDIALPNQPMGGDRFADEAVAPPRRLSELARARIQRRS